MRLGEALAGVGEGNRSDCFEVFSRSLDVQWVDKALKTMGTAKVRKRKLPARAVVWLVIGMALFRDRSIEEVVDHLDLVLPDARRDGGTIAEPSIVEGRERLGVAPLVDLFSTTAAHWAGPSAERLMWRGLKVYGVDGTTMRVPDTPDNDLFFGRPSTDRNQAGYPQVRIVALMVLRSHLLPAVTMGPYDMQENTLAATLWPLLPESSLVIVDRGFIAYAVFWQIQESGSHWLSRAKSNLKWRVVKQLAPGDDLIELPIHKKLAKAHPELPAAIPARAIRYQRKGFRPQILLTSLLDSQQYPADEIVELYHERWELELGFDEVKTHTLEREETLRSKSPWRIAQEIWGLLIAYNLIRVEMEHVAERAGLPPRRISYRHSLMLIRTFLLTAWFTAPGALPRHLERLHHELHLLILPERRDRSYPRAVKIKMSNYQRKPAPEHAYRGR
jgi:hypothetical protein